MYNVFDLSLEILKDVCDNKKEFSTAIKDKKLNIKLNDRKSIISICGIVLRNYYLVKYFSNEVLKFNDNDLILANGIFFGVAGFKKVDNVDSVYKWYEEFLKTKGVEYTDNIKKELEDLVKYKKGYKFKNLNKGSLQYFSIYSNLPIWFLNMINKQYNRETMFKVARECSKMPKQYGYKISFMDIENDLNNEISQFNKIDDNLLNYIPEKSLKSLQLVHQNIIFPVQYAEIVFKNKLLNLENKEITLYLAGKNNGYVPFIDKYFDNNKLHIFYKNEKKYLSPLSKIKKNNEKAFDTYKANEDSLEAYLSLKQDLIVYFADSSYLDNFRRLPDYGIVFNQSNIDEYIKSQEKGLEELDKELDVGGCLVYAVPTLNIKETVVQIYKFLEKHKNYHEEYSEMFFPFEKNNSTYYFAILRKN